MGIDVYLKWDGFKKKDWDNQMTGFSVTSGDKGYLREAYHGSPYATHALISEDWAKQPYVEPAWPSDKRKRRDYSYKGCGFVIPNKVLMERLPKVLEVAAERNTKLYQGELQDEVLKAYEDFVKLHGEKEKAGLNPRIYISY